MNVISNHDIILAQLRAASFDYKWIAYAKPSRCLFQYCCFKNICLVVLVIALILLFRLILSVVTYSGGWWRWALVCPDGVAPSRMVSVSASVNLPLHYKVQNFSSGTGSPGWSRKKGHKTVVVCGGGYIFVNNTVASSAGISKLTKRLQRPFSQVSVCEQIRDEVHWVDCLDWCQERTSSHAVYAQLVAIFR